MSSSSDKAMEMVKKYIPSELRLTHQWNQALERFAFSTSVGSPMMRFGFTTFGAGFGAGEAFRFSSTEFEKETKSK